MANSTRKFECLRLLSHFWSNFSHLSIKIFQIFRDVFSTIWRLGTPFDKWGHPWANGGAFWRCQDFSKEDRELRCLA